MAKNDTYKMSFYQFKDEKTNNNITRLTPLDTACHRNYFYQKCFTKDGDSLLFAGEFDKYLNYYMLDLKNQVARQITQGPGDNTFGGFLCNDDKYLYYVKNNKTLNRVDLKTLNEDVVYTSNPDWVSYGTWTSNTSQSHIVGIEIHKDHYSPLKTWDEFAKMFHSKPLCRLFIADLKTGVQEVILEQRCWLGHPIFKPFDDNTIAFCHEGPHDLVDSRIWFTDKGGKNIRKFKEQSKGESCTHEFWIPNGSKMYYVSYKHNDDKRYIYTVDSNTLENELIAQMPNCSHLMSNFDGSLLVGDGCSTPMDVSDVKSYEIEPDNNIYIIDAKQKTSKAIGQHNSSWKVYKESRQITHPHPSFSPDEKNILYTSDFEGETVLYLMNFK